MVVIIITAVVVKRRKKEGFVSERAKVLTKNARPLLANGASYERLKALLGIDVITADDLKRLWQSGKLTPEEVDSILVGELAQQ